MKEAITPPTDPSWEEAQPATPLPPVKKPLPYKLILLAVVLVLITLVSWLAWQQISKQATPSLPTPLPVTSPTPTLTPIPTVQPLPSSTAVGDLQAELAETDLGDFEADLNELDSQANQL